jgi:PhnB protein
MAIAPWLSVPDGAAALRFYQQAFDAADDNRVDGDNGEVHVARLDVGGATFWIQEDPEIVPEASSQGPVRMILTVADPDAWFDRAVAAGATAVAAVHEEHGWRTGRVTDPSGHDWEFSKPVQS